MSTLAKVFTKANAFVFQLTGGRLGSQLGVQSVLLLHTVGRKSGKAYVTPLSYYRDGENYLLVASNWGKENHPDWFVNLLQRPHTTIQAKDRVIHVVARQAQGEDYRRLWKAVTSQNPQYLQYQKEISRTIPIMILTPAASN